MDFDRNIIEPAIVVILSSTVKVLSDKAKWKALTFVTVLLQYLVAPMVAYAAYPFIAGTQYTILRLSVLSLLAGHIVEFILSTEAWAITKQALIDFFLRVFNLKQ